MKKIVYALQVGTYDDVHMSGIFSTPEKANSYKKKFNIVDNPVIREFELDPLDDLVNSDKKLYLAYCKKTGKIDLRRKDIYDSFVNNNVHFCFDHMYYYLAADNDEQAKEMAENMREKFKDKMWSEQGFNAGIQTL